MNPINVQEVGTLGLAVYVLVEIFKRAGFPSRFAPVLALVLGLGIGGVGFMVSGEKLTDGLIAGFWSAASASGVYSGAKSVFSSKTVSADTDPALHPPC